MYISFVKNIPVPEPRRQGALREPRGPLPGSLKAMGVMNELINPGVVGSLERIRAAASPGSRFTHLAGSAGQVDGLSLRERTDLLSRALLADLPGKYAGTAHIFRRALDDPAFTGWMIWPVTETAVTLALPQRSPATSRTAWRCSPS